MTGPLKPMRGAHVTAVAKLRYPLLGSLKLDGFRALPHSDNVVYTKNLKPFANRHLHTVFSGPGYHALDGELICGAPNDPETFSRTSSAVTTRAGEPDLTLYAFDVVAAGLPYYRRLELLNKRVKGLPHVIPVHHELFNDEADLRAYQAWALEHGYEGLMLRDPNGPYKHGESTEREGWLLKLKEFDYDDAVVLEVLELQHNTNPARINETGYTQRSSKKAGKVGGGTLGGFRVRGLTGPWRGRVFNVARGRLTAAQCATLWAVRDTLPGYSIEYKYFPMGSKDAPRFPGYYGPLIPGKHAP